MQFVYSAVMKEKGQFLYNPAHRLAYMIYICVFKVFYISLAQAATHFWPSNKQAFEQHSRSLLKFRKKHLWL